jgi:hypothetical protein
VNNRARVSALAGQLSTNMVFFMLVFFSFGTIKLALINELSGFMLPGSDEITYQHTFEALVADSRTAQLNGWSYPQAQAILLLNVPARIYLNFNLDSLTSLRLQSLFYSLLTIPMVAILLKGILSSKRLLILMWSVMLVQLVPSVFFWNFFGTRDAMLSFFIVSFLLSIVRFYLYPRISNFVILTISLSCLYVCKPYIAVAFLSFVTTWFLFAAVYRRSSLGGALKIAILIWIPLIILPYGASGTFGILRTGVALVSDPSPNGESFLNISTREDEGNPEGNPEGNAESNPEGNAEGNPEGNAEGNPEEENLALVGFNCVSSGDPNSTLDYIENVLENSNSGNWIAEKLGLYEYIQARRIVNNESASESNRRCFDSQLTELDKSKPRTWMLKTMEVLSGPVPFQNNGSLLMNFFSLEFPIWFLSLGYLGYMSFKTKIKTTVSSEDKTNLKSDLMFYAKTVVVLIFAFILVSILLETNMQVYSRHRTNIAPMVALGIAFLTLIHSRSKQDEKSNSL